NEKHYSNTEKNISKKLGFVWDNRENVNLGVMIFNTDYKDKISEAIICDGTDEQYNCFFEGEGFKSIREQTNVNKANMRGIEAVATWDITPDVSWASNYTYNLSKQKRGPFA